MWRDPHKVLNQNGDSHVLTLMPFPTPSHTTCPGFSWGRGVADLSYDVCCCLRLFSNWGETCVLTDGFNRYAEVGIAVRVYLRDIKRCAGDPSCESVGTLRTLSKFWYKSELSRLVFSKSCFARLTADTARPLDCG